MNKNLKVGVFGVGRGLDIAKNFKLCNCEVVAICDFHKERLEKAKAKCDASVGIYENFDDFIEHDMDICILANFFHEHAPYAIKCFEKGIHVYSECISNGTMAEGVELVRAFEKTENVVYFLAENYPQMIFNREMQSAVASGTLGRILYAEGEYNHPGSAVDVDFLKEYNYYPEHWRNYLPVTYYLTHSLGPIMKATGATPKVVTSFAIYDPLPKDVPTAKQVGDNAAIMMTQNDDGSVFRFVGCSKFGGHHNAYRICGTKGTIENMRGMGNKIMLRYNDWEIPEGKEEINCYDPKWNDKDEAMIPASGHGGSDYMTARLFVECVKENKQPEHPFNIYAATAMSSVAILAHRSVLEGGKPYEIPDFRKEEDRIKWENDRLTPVPGTDGSKPNIPCCSVVDHKPTEEQIKGYKELLGIE
ncbi:MAG: Gfo/Idh/MocA family oxidoreductase [Ruminococcaceae bacterium]|nr:Gfo/Idh/MocA family oxidoreductase [Oscillospiraceae bacterium]